MKKSFKTATFATLLSTMAFGTMAAGDEFTPTLTGAGTPADVCEAANLEPIVGHVMSIANIDIGGEVELVAFMEEGEEVLLNNMTAAEVEIFEDAFTSNKELQACLVGNYRSVQAFSYVMPKK
ncbi:hypothetical protein ACVT98_09675 [Vibrio campbellii]